MAESEEALKVFFKDVDEEPPSDGEMTAVLRFCITNKLTKPVKLCGLSDVDVEALHPVGHSFIYFLDSMGKKVSIARSTSL